MQEQNAGLKNVRLENARQLQCCVQFFNGVCNQVIVHLHCCIIVLYWCYILLNITVKDD